MTTTILERLADASVAARGGADLYRFQLDGRIPDHAFAANDDGTITVTGVELLKAGTFNGFPISEADLVDMTTRFAMLRDAGVFVPPFRLDHGWSVLDVIGYFGALSTERRVDTTDNVERLFLLGDVVITGSLDYTPDVIVAAMKRGALRLRSSELGAYVTNAGVEYPLAYYGCAFVDIPAVEGLAPIKLKREQQQPHRITNLNADTEGTPTMDPKKLARLVALRALNKLSTDQGDELAELETEATAAGVTDADLTDVVPDPEVVEVPDEDPTGDPTDPPAGTGDPNPADPPAVETPEQAELRTARAEIARLRGEETTRNIATFREAGIIVAANEAAATTLLGHTDAAVRTAAVALLGGVPSTVVLRQKLGHQPSTPGAGGTGTAATKIELGMDKDTVGALWANLSREERAARQDEYDAWRRDALGITD